MKMLNNKIIIVTGGSGLIGKSIINKIKSEGGFAINADILLIPRIIYLKCFILLNPLQSIS